MYEIIKFIFSTINFLIISCKRKFYFLAKETISALKFPSAKVVLNQYIDSEDKLLLGNLFEDTKLLSSWKLNPNQLVFKTPAFYNLCLRSSLEELKPFRRWNYSMIEKIRKTGFCSFSTEEKLSPQDFVFSFKEKESKEENLTIRDIEFEREKLLEEFDNFEIEEEKLSEAEGDEVTLMKEKVIPNIPPFDYYGNNRKRESIRDTGKTIVELSLKEDIRDRCSEGGKNNSKNNKEAKKFVRDVYEKSKEINLEDREFVDEFFLFVKRESERIVMSQSLLEKDLD